ncbi:MAG: FAD-linked oxidase, partial [Hyphomicrobiaceae bacterium]
GAARDHLLGFNAVSGRAEVFKSGGRVMKNVTGYDLSKLVTGSFGTLAVLSDVTFKVLPAPETEQSLLVGGLAVEDALRLLRHASGSPHEVSCLAYLPEETVSVGQAAGCAVLRLEGVEVSVVARRKSLIDLFKAWPGAMFETLTGAASANLWQAVRDAAPVAAGGHAVWRVSVAPSAGGEVVAACRAQGLDLASHYFDWAGGLVWLAVEQSIDDAGACIIRRAVDAVGGHALLMRAPAAVRTEVPVFHPQPPSLAALTRRVKEAFDPEGVLSPGRMSRDF